MTTTVELERAGAFEAITYGDFEIENGTSDVRIAPEATITTANSVPVESNQRVRIVIDGVTRFEGRTTSEGTRRRNGQRRVRAEHEAYRVFDEAVSVGPSSDAATILSDAIAATSFAAGLSVNYTGTSETLTEDYDVTNRKVKSIFRDIVDRTNRVWWIAADGTITVQPRGGRGEWTSVSLPGDDAAIDSYEAGDTRSVVNDVTVVGTGGERVEGNATDSTSISEYGRRSETFNLQYVTTASEADAAAAELLQPTPLNSASVIVGRSVGTNPDQNLANYSIALTDPSFELSGDSFVIESQSVEQGRVTLEVGEAATDGVDTINRKSKSNGDVTDLGNVVGSGQLGDQSVDTPQLVDTAVIEQKLADAAVTSGKLVDGSVLEQKLDDLSVSETKIQDESISTPKVQAGAITASEIFADTITANEIASDTIRANEIEAGTITAGEIAADTITALQIAAGTITANEIATGTITANEIDTLELDTTELTIGVPPVTGIEFEVESTASGATTNMIPTGTINPGRIGTSSQPFRTMEAGTMSASTFDGGDFDGDSVDVTGDVNCDDVFADRFDGSSLDLTGDITCDDITSDFLDCTNLTIEGDIYDIETVSVNNAASLRPSSDNEGALGTSFAAWSDVASHSFTTATPEPLSGVSCRDVTGYDWHNPPECVAQKKAAKSDDREYKRFNPSKGIEMGHMTNWLLEVTKDQQRVIESLESTVDDLESRIEQLEAAVGPNA